MKKYASFTGMEGDRVIEKSLRYWAFSDYSESFNPVNKCTLVPVLED